MIVRTSKCFGLILNNCLDYRYGTTLTLTRVTLVHRTPTLTPL